jgi:hypothetical protein
LKYYKECYTLFLSFFELQWVEAVATLFLLCYHTAVTLATVLVLVHCAYVIDRSIYQFAVPNTAGMAWDDAGDGLMDFLHALEIGKGIFQSLVHFSHFYLSHR